MEELPGAVKKADLVYLNGSRAMTQGEIGEVYGVSRRVVNEWFRIAGIEAKMGRRPLARVMTREELDARADEVQRKDGRQKSVKEAARRPRRQGRVKTTYGTPVLCRCAGFPEGAHVRGQAKGCTGEEGA